jgi:hypothetical protein
MQIYNGLFDQEVIVIPVDEVVQIEVQVLLLVVVVGDDEVEALEDEENNRLVPK